MTATVVQELQAQLPVKLQPYPLAGRTVGLVIVDEVNGFCTVGAGNLGAAGARRPGRAHGRGDRPARPALRRGEARDPRLPRHPRAGQARAALPAALRARQRRGEPGAGARLARGLRLRDAAAQGLHQRLRRRHRGELHPRRPRPAPQQGGRLGQQPPPRCGGRGRHLHRHLRDGLRPDDAVGAQPRPDADARGHRGLRAGDRDLRPAARRDRGARACRRPRPTPRPRPTTWGSTSWPRAARCWRPSWPEPRPRRAPARAGPSSPARARSGYGRPARSRAVPPAAAARGGRSDTR